MGLFEASNFSSVLQKKLDSLHIPIAIFINEVNLGQPAVLDRNKNLLKSWLVKDYITAGNHGFAHKNFADVGFDAFKEDVLKGEVVTKELLKQEKKELRYFRFPFNGAGNDSLEQMKALQFLKEKKYISTPYTVESEDWLHAILYDKALAEGDTKTASWIGAQYVDFTLRLFTYFDSLSLKMYNRSISHIYLCHDNKLNADYLPEIVNQLKNRKYKFVSLDEAMKDPVYKSPLHYYGKNGFSWIYRWIPDVEMRKKLMREEPTNGEIQKAFEEMNKK
ncbi:hypothetical protein Dfri01_27720 [Dyadobacter frigoris]|nr:hypothetical protein Dfri01_27720 [Dyadobacter frigoris]